VRGGGERKAEGKHCACVHGKTKKGMQSPQSRAVGKGARVGMFAKSAFTRLAFAKSGARRENKRQKGMQSWAKVGKSRVERRRCAFRSQLLPINVYLRFFSWCAFKLAMCVRSWQRDFRCFLACKVKVIPSQRDGIRSLVLSLADSRCGTRFSCCVRSLCVC
jgi:hypothetical protein